MAGFALSFAVIGLFWIGHHGLFRRIKGLDRSLILLNLLFLGALPGVPPPLYRWNLLRILPSPVVFLLSIPVALGNPVLAQLLWLLALFGALLIRHLEPSEVDPDTTEGDDSPEPR
jgi:hypothetical protein